MATRGSRRHLVFLQDPPSVQGDGDGGYTEEWTALDPPSMKAEIRPATARELERVFAETVTATAQYVVTLDYHPGITHRTRLLLGERVFSIEGIANPDLRNAELILACAEVVA